ncbi:unnamed protein product [Lactuca saligna]|uniref:Uncharacterized protein n=1 Tax=Lactuca saligna TaxID=75948 RepID=A0AA35YRJ5_LACSI|nr:unnamed protein product [Lactuca saligna]
MISKTQNQTGICGKTSSFIPKLYSEHKNPPPISTRFVTNRDLQLKLTSIDNVIQDGIGGDGLPAIAERWWQTMVEWWRFCGSGWHPYCWLFLLLVVHSIEGKGKAVTGFQGCLSTCLIEKESKEESLVVYGGGAWSTKTVVAAGGVWAVGSGRV